MRKYYMGCAGKIEEHNLAEAERSGIYVAEPKCDGIFAACIANSTQKFFSRTGKEKRIKMPTLPSGTILVGELGYGSQEAKRRQKELGHQFIDVYDVLKIRGHDVTQEDDVRRREILDELFYGLPNSAREYFFLVPQWTSRFQHQCDLQSEGLILKQIKDRPHHPYVGGTRTKFWYKVKKQPTVDMVIMDFELSDAWEGHDEAVAKNVVCGVFKNGELTRMVKVGSFDLALKIDMAKNFRKYKGCVAELKCFKVFKSGSLRHPSLVQLRDDKSPKDCTFEALQEVM